jgi:hypothetical protein
MNRSRRKKRTTLHADHARAILPTIVAVGGSLAAGQAGALELGALEVHSKLGQPLRASIAFALGPNEMLESYCVSLARDPNGFVDVSGTRVSVANGIISLTGNVPINEPLVTANLVVKCPYTANISRNYSMFIDPVDRPVAFAYSSAPEPENVASAAPVAQAVDREPVAIGSRYQVQSGDSLSEIAWRLESREISLQAAMDGILAANPQAFTNGDPNRLQAGRWLDIPTFVGTAAAEAPASTEQQAGVADGPALIDTVPGAALYEPATTLEADGGESEPVTATVSPPDSSAPAEAPASEAAPAEETADATAASASGFDSLRPGDIVDDALITGVVATEAATPDAATAPARIAETRVATDSGMGFWDWLPWALTAFFAALSGYLAFGPRLRQRFGSKPIGAEPIVERRVSQPRAIVVPESRMQVEEIQPQYGAVDFDLSDNSPTDENPALDANLFSGAGLAEVDDGRDEQDFGFAETTSIDMELPDRPAVMDISETDIIAPPERTREAMILDSEVLPDEDEYDMSIIVDATKMPNPNDVTERDLMAVQVDEEPGETMITDAYTINDDVDIDLLEQDYEDELTATQALNAEIEKAAAELAQNREPDTDSDLERDASGDTSVQIRLASVTDLDLTAEMDARNDDSDAADIDDTASIDASDETVEMTAKNKTAG